MSNLTHTATPAKPNWRDQHPVDGEALLDSVDWDAYERETAEPSQLPIIDSEPDCDGCECAHNPPRYEPDPVSQIEEYWDADAPQRGRGDPRTVAWTDELAASFYLEQLGADALCLCGHDAQQHRWTMLGSERSKCDVCWKDGAIGCPKFEPSPYYCNECGEPKADPLSAISCCLCLGCGHARQTHMTRTAASIVSKPSRCSAKWCGCNGFGGVIPLELAAVAS